MNSLRVMLVGALTLGAAAAQAADSVDLTITGTIVPAACTPTLSTNTLDFGTIPVADLNAASNTTLTGKPVTLTLTCDAAAKVAIQTIDNRSGSALAATPDVYGLGFAPGNVKIGEYSIQSSSVTGDSASKSMLTSTDGGTNWSDAASGASIATNSIYAMADAAGATEPGSYTVQSFDLNVIPTIAPADSLPTSSAFELDGSVTFEVVYL